MAVIIRVGETGKDHRINCNFDLSSNTSLDLVYTKPSGATLPVSATIGTSQEVIDGVQVEANFWLFYTFDVGDLDEPGNYDVQVTYNNTAPMPDDIFKNLTPVTLVVGA